MFTKFFKAFALVTSFEQLLEAELRKEKANYVPFAEQLIDIVANVFKFPVPQIILQKKVQLANLLQAVVQFFIS